MSIDLRWAVIGLALALAGCGDKQSAATSEPAGNATAAVSPAGQDWTETVSETSEGGYRMGNPEAAVKLVEYASLTCPHCAEFSKTATAALKAEYVATGKVSWEYRTFVLNPIDISASLMARCQGAGPFFKLVEQIYAEQASWIAKFQTLSSAEQQRISALPENQQFQALAKAGQLDQFFRARGLPEAKAEACLLDKAGLDRIVAIRERGTNQDGVTGTPSFMINGTQQEGVYDWPGLQAKLRAAVGG